MKYTGGFKSVLKDKLYTVNIVTNGSSSTEVNITLGTNAFTTEMDGGSNTIYVPVKYSSASIQIVANNYYFDMYSSTAKQNSVQLLDASSNVLWTGYVSPNIYDAPYDFITESWKVEAIDGLSVLKYYDYTPVSGTMGFASFTDIINNCLSTCGCYNKWYFSTATHIPSKGYLTDNLYVSEADFFDEDYAAMKMNEVLEEVCKFCGVTAVAYGTNVYFIDYDALMGNNPSYYEHTVGNSSAVTSKTYFNSSHNITAESYSASGTNLSLDNVYSKVTVKDSLYTVKSIIPSLFEDEDLDNVKYVNEGNQNWTYEFTQRCMDRGELKVFNTDSNDTYFFCKSRYYTNKKYNHYNYINNGPGPTMTKLIENSVMDATQRTGVLFSRFNVATGKTDNIAKNNLGYDDFSNYLMMSVNHINNPNNVGVVRLETKPEFAKPFFMSGKAKLIATGTMILTDRYTFKSSDNPKSDVSAGYFPDVGTVKADFHGWTIFGIDIGDTLWLPKYTLKLKVDVGLNNSYVSSNIPFYEEGADYEYLREDAGWTDKHREVFYENHDIQNTSAGYNISTKGYIMNTGLSSTDVVPAKPIVRMYGMDDLVTYFRSNGGNPVACVFIKDFDIQAEVPHEGGKDENATNTEYSYVIDDDYISELGAIEFKICTYDNKQLNYSSVAWLDPSTNKYQFLDTLTSDSLSQTQRAEHLMCYRIVNQYSSPSKKLSINLFADDIYPWTTVNEPLLNDTFIVDSVSYNWYYDRAEVNLVEKK